MVERLILLGCWERVDVWRLLHHLHIENIPIILVADGREELPAASEMLEVLTIVKRDDPGWESLLFSKDVLKRDGYQYGRKHRRWVSDRGKRCHMKCMKTGRPRHTLGRQKKPRNR